MIRIAHPAYTDALLHELTAVRRSGLAKALADSAEDKRRCRSRRRHPNGDMIFGGRVAAAGTDVAGRVSCAVDVRFRSGSTFGTSSRGRWRRI